MQGCDDVDGCLGKCDGDDDGCVDSKLCDLLYAYFHVLGLPWVQDVRWTTVLCANVVMCWGSSYLGGVGDVKDGEWPSDLSGCCDLLRVWCSPPLTEGAPGTPIDNANYLVYHEVGLPERAESMCSHLPTGGSVTKHAHRYWSKGWDAEDSRKVSRHSDYVELDESCLLHVCCDVCVSGVVILSMAFLTEVDSVSLDNGVIYSSCASECVDR